MLSRAATAEKLSFTVVVRLLLAFELGALQSHSVHTFANQDQVLISSLLMSGLQASLCLQVYTTHINVQQHDTQTRPSRH